jgi:DNA-binding MarR family transcriptional regulator
MEGRIIKQIVESDGCCLSMSSIARGVGAQKSRVSIICKVLIKKGYITVERYGNRKVLKLHENVFSKALKIMPAELMGEVKK